MMNLMNFFDAPLQVMARTGEMRAVTFARISDPDIAAFEMGSIPVNLGAMWLARDILQAAMPPATVDEWLARLSSPPSCEELSAALAPYREAFDLSRAFQAPSPFKEGFPLLAPLAIDALVVGQPTENAIANGDDFFTSRAIPAIGAGAILPVLYAHMVLFCMGSGGYYVLPQGPDAAGFQLLGRTLWESLWLNVIPVELLPPEARTAPWPAPVDASVFPWLHEGLRYLPLERGATISLLPGHLHPAHIPMPRRYLLVPPVAGRCGLTGLDGPVFTGYSRWSGGLDYGQSGYVHPRTLCDAEGKLRWLRRPPTVGDWLLPSALVAPLPPTFRALRQAVARGGLGGITPCAQVFGGVIKAKAIASISVSPEISIPLSKDRDVVETAVIAVHNDISTVANALYRAYRAAKAVDQVHGEAPNHLRHTLIQVAEEAVLRRGISGALSDDFFPGLLAEALALFDGVFQISGAGSALEVRYATARAKLAGLDRDRLEQQRVASAERRQNRRDAGLPPESGPSGPSGPSGRSGGATTAAERQRRYRERKNRTDQ